MIMSGKEVCSITELKQNFEIDDLIYSYCNGELSIWLRKIGENKAADQVDKIPKQNALLLIRLYQILGIEPEMTDEEIRSSCT